jgi:hypothetical protein
VDYRTDVRLLGAKRWPTSISATQFRDVTGEQQFPAHLDEWVKDSRLEYYCNNSLSYTVRGTHVKLEVLWNWEAPPGSGDVYQAEFRGTKATVKIRQGKEEKFRPELYVQPGSRESRKAVFAALGRKLEALQKQWTGLAMREEGDQARILIPDRFRVDHETHFSQVTRAFLQYLGNPKSFPSWEKSNMLVKYYITTRGVELGRGERRPAHD